MTAVLRHNKPQIPADPRFGSVDGLFFVIGAQKSGTSWLYNFCADHPEITVCGYKESNYWNYVAGEPISVPALDQSRRRLGAMGVLKRVQRRFTRDKRKAERRRGMEALLRAHDNPVHPHREYADAVFQKAGPQTRFAGEICPQYAFLEPATFRQMRQLNEKVKFVFIMRDPVARFVSGVLHKLKRSVAANELSPDLLSASILEALERPLSARPSTLWRSQYDRTIQNLEAAVAPEDIQFLFFEKLFEQDTVDAFCELVGISKRNGEFQKVVHHGTGKNDHISDNDRLAIARALSPVYEFAIKRFGADLPEEWLQSAALANVPVTEAINNRLRSEMAPARINVEREN